MSCCVYAYKAVFTPGHMLPGNMCPGRATCIRIHIMSTDTCIVADTSCSFGIHVARLHNRHQYPCNRRATNCQQFCCRCCRYKKHVDGNKWIQVDTTCVRQHVSRFKRGLMLSIRTLCDVVVMYVTA